MKYKIRANTDIGAQIKFKFISRVLYNANDYNLDPLHKWKNKRKIWIVIAEIHYNVEKCQE